MHFCLRKQITSNPLSPTQADTFPGTSPWVVAKEGGRGGQLAGGTGWEQGRSVRLQGPTEELRIGSFISVSAQLSAAPEPLLSPSGRLDHLGDHRDAMSVGKSLLTLPV